MDKKTVIDTARRLVFWTVGIYLVALITGKNFPVVNGGYIHAGDVFVCAAAIALPWYYAIIVSVLSLTLVDITLGATGYIIGTIIIKTLMVMTAKMFLKMSDEPLTQDLLVCLTGLFTICGYYVVDFILALIRGNGIISAMADASVLLMPNTLQALATTGIFLCISVLFRKKTESDKQKDDDDDNA